MASQSVISRYVSSLICKSRITHCQRVSQIRPFRKSSLKMAIDLGEMHKPTNFQRKVLVWAGSYKTVAEVPDRVSTSQLKRAMDLFRIRVNIGMVLSAAVSCAIAIYFGRKLRDAGGSLDAEGTRMRENWERIGAEERAQKAQANLPK